MHRLYTTNAYVISALPHGESNRVYRLLTEELGVVYAHGQGVRELHNRNRYALARGGMLDVSLVKGREVWRITGARETAHVPLTDRALRTALVRLLSTVRMLAPSDMPLPEVYTIVVRAHEALARGDIDPSVAELLGTLYILDYLGYVAHDADVRRHDFERATPFAGEACSRLADPAVRRDVLLSINRGLRAAHV